jgi:hypothetical protein
MFVSVFLRELSGKDVWRAVSYLQAFYRKVCRKGDGLMQERFGNEKREVENVECWKKK